ncbi:MAG: alpha/beta hydrolase [Betaproteobacteria bacterium]|nr:alpha/beta hydrolase [Betaproteobacteria bacterium]
MPRYKLRIDGPLGRIETVVEDPGPSRRGVALIAHPHPLHGGSLKNKVVQTAARALGELGYVAVRPNFRGVGQSDGDFDHGRGEVDDMAAIAAFVCARYPGLPLVLIGFSFGAYVQVKLGSRLACKGLLLIAPAVNMFDFGPVAAPCLVLHGAHDALVPLGAVRAWAQPQDLRLAVVEGADHFFHGKLSELKRLIVDLCEC